MIVAFSLLPRWAARGAVAASLLLTLIAPAAVTAQDAEPAPAEESAEPAADPAATEAPADGTTTTPAEATEPAAATDATAPAGPATTAAGNPVPTIPVDAQAEEKVDGQKLDTIEVTGSRLRRTDYETAQPVVVLSREDIERTGLTDVSQILRNLTVAGNNSLTMQQGRLSLSLGETNLDLRNLGAQHTLLLVNGRRWVTGLIPTQPSVSDFNTIPTAIIERIEVLKDGASAIYGSDAIGGVVNIITRKDYEGLGINYHFGSFIEQGDGINHQAAVSWGMNRPGQNLFVNLSYTDQGDTPASNRPFTATSTPTAGITRWSATTRQGRFQFVANNTTAAQYQCPNLQAGIAADTVGANDLRQAAIVPAGLVLCDLRLNQGEPGGDPTMYSQLPPTADRTESDLYNKFEAGSLTEPNERTALYAQFAQQLWGNITYNVDALYNKRKSTTVGQALPVLGGNLGGNKGYLSGISAINTPWGHDVGIDSSCGANPDPTATGSTCTGLGIGSGAWQMRLPQDRAIWEFIDEVDTMRLANALRGDYEIFGIPVGWDFGYIYANNKIHNISPLFRYDLEAIALDPSQCGNACLDVFHGQAGLTAAALDFIYHDAYQDNESTQHIGYGDISAELAFDWWAPGPIAMAIGLEMRRDEYTSVVDPVVQQGLTILNTQQNTAGETKADEVYLELGIPLVRGYTAMEEIDLNIAGRVSQYPRIGKVTTGQAGLLYRPVDELLLRTTYSHGFRAPNIGELFLPPSQSYDAMSDPCAEVGTGGRPEPANTNCNTDGVTVGGAQGQVSQPYSLWSGNPDLAPEKSRNLTYGLVFSPTANVNLALDFYEIEIQDFITIGGGLAQHFLDSCYKSDPSQRSHCGEINRNQAGALLSVDLPFTNLGAVETSGIDFAVDYVLPIPEDFGTLKAGLDVNYLKEYDVVTPRVGQGDLVEGQIGHVSGLFSGWPRWKAGTQFLWNRDEWKASWSSRLAYTMKEDCNDIYGDTDPTIAYSALGLCSDPKFDADGVDISENELKTVIYHNVQFGRDFNAYNTKITLGINNVLDQDPPVSYSMVGFYWYNYDPNHYEIPGRLGYLKVDYKF